MDINLDFLKPLQRRMAIRAFRKTRESFYEELAESIREGEALARFFSVRGKRAVAQKDPLAVLYSGWLRRMDGEGGRLSHILKGTAPDIDLMIIAAQDTVMQGLPATLEFLASAIKSQRKLQSVVVKAMLVPAIVVIMAIIFMVVLALLVVPVFSMIAPPETWGPVGYTLYLTSYAITHYGLVIGAALAGLVWLYAWSISNWTGPVRVKADGLALYRIFRDYNSAQFLVAVASLLAAGVGIAAALDELKKRSNPWLRWHITKISRNLLRTSRSYGEAFDTGALAQATANRLADSSRRSSDFPAVMKKVGITGMDKTREEVEKSAFRLNIVMTIALGVLVGAMILGTMRTGQDLAAAMKRQVNKQQIHR